MPPSIYLRNVIGTLYCTSSFKPGPAGSHFGIFFILSNAVLSSSGQALFIILKSLGVPSSCIVKPIITFPMQVESLAVSGHFIFSFIHTAKESSPPGNSGNLGIVIIHLAKGLSAILLGLAIVSATSIWSHAVIVISPAAMPAATLVLSPRFIISIFRLYNMQTYKK